MVLIAAAVCTKGGKALVSRQFVEMTRARIEGLLAAFPKLMGSDKGPGATKQHTFVETESVRYVYQPLDQLYMLLITTKASNILEDLETLRLFSRVIPEYCRSMDEKEILENSFQLIFAFDEVVALGYRENVNLAQIRTFTEMDSHEERVYMEIKKSQEREAKEKAKDEARRLQAVKKEAAKRGMRGSATGIGSGANSGGFGGGSGGFTQGRGGENAFADSTVDATTRPAAPVQSKSLGPSKALRLGGKTKDVDTFVDQLKSEGQEIISPSKIGKGAPTTVSNNANAVTKTEGITIRTEEKLSIEMSRDGHLNSLDLNGLTTLKVSDDKSSRIRIKMQNSDRRGAQLQTHPNLDKELFRNDSVLALKNPQKPFPTNSDVGVLKWRVQSQDDALVPMSINCWPTESGNGCDVNIEYTLEMPDLELQDVVISIPLPSGAAPVVKDCDGEYKYERVRSSLDWKLPVVDRSNKTGSLEFSTSSGHPDNFFPIRVQFHSQIQYCDIVPTEVIRSDDNSPAKYSFESILLTEKFEVV